LVGVVLEVRALHDHRLPRRRAEAGAQRGALAAVLRVQQQAVQLRAELALQQLARAVGREIVDDDDLLVGPGSGADRVEDARDRRLFVVAGNHDRKLHGLVALASASLSTCSSTAPRCSPSLRAQTIRVKGRATSAGYSGSPSRPSVSRGWSSAT